MSYAEEELSARPRTADGKFLRIFYVGDLDKIGNLPKVKTAIMCAKTNNEDCVVLSVLVGNFLTPSTCVTDNGIGIMAAINDIGFDYAILGTHDFFMKQDRLERRIKEFKGTLLNSNIRSPRFFDGQDKPLPDHAIVEVGNRTVALMAFLDADNGSFVCTEKPQLQPPTEVVAGLWANIVKAHGRDIDALIPMSHAHMKKNRDLIRHARQQPGLAEKLCVLLGGHRHADKSIFASEANVLMCKPTGNANDVCFVDVWWTADGVLKREAHMIDEAEFQAEPGLERLMSKGGWLRNTLQEVPVLILPEQNEQGEKQQWSTKSVKHREEPLVSLLLKMVKDAVDGVDLVMLQANFINGNSDYSPGPFSGQNLWREFAFETNLYSVKLPGSIIEESIRCSRDGGRACQTKACMPTTGGSTSTAVPDGALFLHCDTDTVIDPDKASIKKINRARFDPDKMYTVLTSNFLLRGRLEIPPLAKYVEQTASIPATLSCSLPIKHCIINACLNRAWQDVVNQFPPQHPRPIDAEEIRVFLRQVFLDLSGNDDEPIDEHSDMDDNSSIRSNRNPILHTLFWQKTILTQNMAEYLLHMMDLDTEGKVYREVANGS